MSATNRKRTTQQATNVTFQHNAVRREQRAAILGRHPGYRGCTLWFTGLSGAGKTTLAFGLEKALIQGGIPAYCLDGDNVRHGLCKNLGFSDEDRTENIRRVAEVSKLFADMGTVTLASFISPIREDRNEARRIHEADGIKFFEVYVNTPLDVCESRDPKNLYKKARAGDIKSFTGIDSLYEEPLNADLVLNTDNFSEVECIERLLFHLLSAGVVPPSVLDANNFLPPNPSPVRELFVTDAAEREALAASVADAPVVDLQLQDLQWLQVLAEGWATPLAGFMRERQYLQVLHFGQLLDIDKKCRIPGVEAPKEAEDDYSLSKPLSQSIPIVLPVDSAVKHRAQGATRAALKFNGKLIAVLDDLEIFPHRRHERCHRQFAICDPRHPTVNAILNSGEYLMGGDLKVLVDRITYDDGLDEYRKTPLELRKMFSDAGCDAVFAFQLRNPIHNGHALLMQDTREQLLKRHRNPMLLLHPLGGWTKDDDVPLPVRIRQHQAVMDEGVLDRSWTVLAIFPSPMLYAGPTEVQWHARARLAAGINTYIVGRDPAGIQHPDNKDDFLYDPTHGAKVLAMTPGLSNLEIIPFRVAAYDQKIKRMAFFDEQRKTDFLFISGTKMRGFARDAVQPPDGFMAPKAWTVLADYYKEKAEREAAAAEARDTVMQIV